VLVAGVVRHVVDQHAQPAVVRRREQLIEVGQRAEDGVDIGVVRHVVAEVGHGGRIEGRDPDGVDPEPCQVVEPPRDACQVTGPAAGRVGEGARIDLVDDACLPPPRGTVLHTVQARQIRARRSRPYCPATIKA
jgi:hypothetical protein